MTSQFSSRMRISGNCAGDRYGVPGTFEKRYMKTFSGARKVE
ncbi:Uncharacterised protein [Mycobacterium tuberculosis]|nr:Uncharacterised protein [Mycobacterium tuberculosis]